MNFIVILIVIISLLIVMVYFINKKQVKEKYPQKSITSKKFKNDPDPNNNNNSLKCVIYCNYDDTALINFLADTSQYSFVVTHLHIMVNWETLPMNTNITNVQSFIQDLSGINLSNNVCTIQQSSGLITPMIQQINCLEQNCLQQLQSLQQRGVKLILAMQPGPGGYYGYRTIPNDTCSCQPISPNNPLDNFTDNAPSSYICPQCSELSVPTLFCPYLNKPISIGMQLVNDLVQSFFTSGMYRPARLQYDGADIIDQNYYCASGSPVITNCSTLSGSNCTPSGSCIPPSGPYSVYNILQFMYNLKHTAQLINPNFTLSKGLIYDCDLVCSNGETEIEICDPGSNSSVTTNGNLGIIDYGCSFYTENDPYENFYSSVINKNQMLLSLDFSQSNQQQNYQSFMQYDISYNYGGIVLFSLTECNYGNNTGGICNLNVDDILQYWNSLLCMNVNLPYYLNGQCSQCLSNNNCTNTQIPYCINGMCKQCILDYDCSSTPTPFCISGQCSQCLPGFIGNNCICPLKSNSCINGTVIYNASTNSCDCSCNIGWTGTECNIPPTSSVRAVFGGHSDDECYGECPNQITDHCNTPEANLWIKLGDGDGWSISCDSCSDQIGSKNYCGIPLSTFIPSSYLMQATKIASSNPVDPLWYEVPGMTNCSSNVRGESNGAYLTNYLGDIIDTNTNCNNDTYFYIGRNITTAPISSNIVYGTFVSECPDGWNFIKNISYNPLNPYTGNNEIQDPIAICSINLGVLTNSLLITGGNQNLVVNKVTGTAGKSYNTSDKCTGSYSQTIGQPVDNVLAVSLDLNNILNASKIMPGDDSCITTQCIQSNLCCST